MLMRGTGGDLSWDDIIGSPSCLLPVGTQVTEEPQVSDHRSPVLVHPHDPGHLQALRQVTLWGRRSTGWRRGWGSLCLWNKKKKKKR